MRITIAQYGRTLYALTENKSNSEVDNIIVRFLKVLRKKNQMKLANKIIEKFSEIYNKKNGIVEAEVITSRNNNQETRNKQIEKFIKEKYQAKKVILNNKIDLDIKGGIIIKVGDEILDGSVARQLDNLKKVLAD